MTSVCPRLGTIEALRDGRLATRDADALDAHVLGCPECSSQLARLDALGAALRSLPEPKRHPARELAEKRRLLDAASQGTRRPRRWRTASVVLAGAALAGAVPLVARQAPPEVAGPSPASSHPAGLELRIEPGPGARWSRSSLAEAEVLMLSEGRLHVAVARHDPARRLTLKLPDGELVDVGTVFDVDVAGGRTRLVSVSHGRVLLRLRGRPEQQLDAGERFEAAPESPARPDPTSPAAAARPSPHEHAAAPTPSCPKAAFEECAEAFKRGAFSSAAGHCERYSASCAGGNHAEDAAYLRMVALARAGRSAEARAQASAYVQRFPHGFRVKEAERIAASE